jgi:hypothetical protein
MRHLDAEARIASDQADQPVHHLIGVNEWSGRHDDAQKDWPH